MILILDKIIYDAEISFYQMIVYLFKTPTARPAGHVSFAIILLCTRYPKVLFVPFYLVCFLYSFRISDLDLCFRPGNDYVYILSRDLCWISVRPYQDIQFIWFAMCTTLPWYHKSCSVSSVGRI